MEQHTKRESKQPQGVKRNTKIPALSFRQLRLIVKNVAIITGVRLII